MDNIALDNLEIAPPEVVLQAARDFAGALAETPEFQAFEQAIYQLHKDPQANQAREAYQKKQTSLEALIQLNAVPLEEQAELERLRQTYLGLACVEEYLQAETGLRLLCQELSRRLSQQIGLDFATASGSGCCG